MKRFGWIARGTALPWQWDLRRLGWALCALPPDQCARCRHVLLLDARGHGGAEPPALLSSDRGRQAQRIVALGVEDSAARATLLARGCADAVPSSADLLEIEARASRVAERAELLPRLRMVGPLILDLFHRDVCIGNAWVGLHPREFGLLWRLSDEPGRRVSRGQLLRDVWRIFHEPETNSVEVHVSRLRAKLAGAGCGHLIETAVEGGYRLIGGPSLSLPAGPPSREQAEPHSRPTPGQPRTLLDSDST